MKQLFLVAALLIAACSNAPSAQEAPATYEAVYHDPERASLTLQTLSSDAFEGRRTGEPGNLKAMEYIEEKLATLDAVPLRKSGYRAPFNAPKFDTLGETISGTNLLAKIEGKSSAAPVIVMSAHFDHLGIIEGEIFNGADDNASGVAALLELVSWFNANPPESDIIFAFFDAEEQGLTGAVHFVSSMDTTLAERIAINLNLDMVSRADKGEIYAVGSFQNPDLVPLIDNVASTAPLKLLRGHDSPEWGEQDWSLQSDHAAFLRAGYPFIYLGVEDHADYHRESDEFGKIDPEMFARAVDTIVMLAEATDTWVAAQK